MSMSLRGPNPRYRVYKSPRFYRTIVGDILSGAWKRGSDVQDLEAVFRDRLGVGHALATAQARVAIYLAIRAILERQEDPSRREVVVSPYTIFDVINMVVAAGAKPVFADLAEGTCNVSAEAVERAMTDRTAAVMVTHLQGAACDVRGIADLCRSRGVALVEDCAQALGTEVDGRQVGTFGDVGIYSFGLAKNVNAIYGGMAVTDDEDLDRRMRAVEAEFPQATLGWLLKKAAYAFVTDVTLTPPLWGAFFFRVFRFGYLRDVEVLNKRVTVEDDPQLRPEFPKAYRRRMTPLQARLVAAQLPKVASDRETRQRYAALYRAGLEDIPDIVLPPVNEENSHTYLVYPVLVPDRHALVAHLMRSGRDCAVQHLKNCADLECFDEYRSDCPVARETAGDNLLLPTYPSFGEAEVRRMIEAVRSYFVKEGSGAELGEGLVADAGSVRHDREGELLSR